MKSTIKIALTIIVAFFMSCSTMKHSIEINKKFTDEKISYFLEKNGNVFYLSSTYLTFSTVWTYSNGQIEIYKLTNDKISLKEEFSTISIYNMEQISKEDLFELDKFMELDGDSFGYRIKRDLEIEKEDLSIDIDCFTKLRYKSKFLNKIVEDINNYKIGGNVPN